MDNVINHLFIQFSCRPIEFTSCENNWLKHKKRKDFTILQHTKKFHIIKDQMKLQYFKFKLFLHSVMTLYFLHENGKLWY